VTGPVVAHQYGLPGSLTLPFSSLVAKLIADLQLALKMTAISDSREVRGRTEPHDYIASGRVGIFATARRCDALSALGGLPVTVGGSSRAGRQGRAEIIPGHDAVDKVRRY
jgi:hypothetical protein